MGEQYKKTIAPGVNLHINRVPKFKTTTIKAYLIRDLDEQTTWGVLLPKVLLRGTSDFPTAVLFEQALDDNFGSKANVRARKIGEHQLLEFTLQLPGSKYLTTTGADQVLPNGLHFMEQLLYQPLLEESRFKAQYVEQEKKALLQEIESVFNDKESWAMQRCIELSCEGEPFAIPSYGLSKDVPTINPENLTRFYQNLIDTAPMEIFVVGDVDPEQVEALIKGIIPNRERQIATVKQRTQQPQLTKVKSVIEEDKLFQGKLVMSLRTTIDPLSDQLPAHILFNSILGGGTHSKIFTTVREKNSLAYYAHSGMQRNKQMIFIEAGIELSKFEAATALIKQCFVDITEGAISDTELEQAKTSLINYLWSLEDYSGGGIEYELIGFLAGRSWSIQEMEEKLQAVSIADVQAAAQKSVIDTVYFLSPEGGTDDE